MPFGIPTPRSTDLSVSLDHVTKDTEKEKKKEALHPGAKAKNPLVKSTLRFFYSYSKTQPQLFVVYPVHYYQCTDMILD